MVDLVYKCFQQVIEGHGLYMRTFLVNESRQATADGAYRSSRHAVLRIGETAAGDPVVTVEWGRGQDHSLFQKSGDDTIAAELEAYECIGGDASFSQPGCSSIV